MKEYTENPFYDNHVFTQADIGRRILTNWERFWLLFKPTYTQCSDGYAWHFKYGSRGIIYLIGYEEMDVISANWFCRDSSDRTPIRKK